MSIIKYGVVLLLLIPSLSVAGGSVLDWTGGSGTTLPGWTWTLDPGNQGYDTYGWAGVNGETLGGAYWPRYFNKTDYYPAQTDPLGQISTINLTPDGNRTLNVYETEIGADGGPGWWFLQAVNFGSRGIASSTDNRGGFYIYLDGMDAWNPASPVSETVHLGTYNGWSGTDGGNTEPEYDESNAPNSTEYADYVTLHGGTTKAGHHYYHTFGMPSGAWLHAVIDQHPTHARSSSGSGKPVNNPLAAYHPGANLNYMEAINRFYLEIRYPQSQLSQYYVGPFTVWSETQNENDESITSPWVGYWPETGKWQVGFQDMSFYHYTPYDYNATTQSTFEIRWSISPITNDNYSSATVCAPEYYERGTTNTFYRQNSWIKLAWTQFDLPDGVESVNNKIYFAIKDVSAIANGDGRNASDIPQGTYVKTIDYTLSVDESDITAPTVDSFIIPSTATSLTISISEFTASDDTAVTGYCVNESPSAPTAGSCSGSGWSASAQTSYTFGGAGSKTLYAWAKDAAGNISDLASDTVDITLPTATFQGISYSGGFSWQ